MAVAIATAIAIHGVIVIRAAAAFSVTVIAMAVISAIATATHVVTATKVSTAQFDRPGRAVDGPLPDLGAGFFVFGREEQSKLGTKWFLTDTCHRVELSLHRQCPNHQHKPPHPRAAGRTGWMFFSRRPDQRKSL